MSQESFPDFNGPFVTVYVNGLFPTIIHFKTDQFLKEECCRLLKCSESDLLVLTAGGKWMKSVTGGWTNCRPFADCFSGGAHHTIMIFKNSGSEALGHGDYKTVVVMEEMAWIVRFNSQESLIAFIADQLKCEQKKVKITTSNGKEIKTWKSEKRPEEFIQVPFLYAFGKA